MHRTRTYWKHSGTWRDFVNPSRRETLLQRRMVHFSFAFCPSCAEFLYERMTVWFTVRRRPRKRIGSHSRRRQEHGSGVDDHRAAWCRSAAVSHRFSLLTVSTAICAAFCAGNKGARLIGTSRRAGAIWSRTRQYIDVLPPQQRLDEAWYQAPRTRSIRHLHVEGKPEICGDSRETSHHRWTKAT